MLIFHVFHDIGSQLVSHRLLVPIGGIQQPLHSLRAAFVQLLGQLPAVLALNPAQQACQETTDPLSHLCSPKVGSDPFL